MTAIQTIKRVVHVLHVQNLAAAAADDVVERVRYDRTVVLVAWMCAWCCCCCWWEDAAGGGGVIVGGGGVVGSEGGGGWCGGGFCCCVCGHWELEVWGLDAELVLSGWRWEVGEGLGLFMYGRRWDVWEVILVRCDVEGLETGYIGEKMRRKKKKNQNPSNFYIDEQSVNAWSMTAAFSRPSYCWP